MGGQIKPSSSKPTRATEPYLKNAKAGRKVREGKRMERREGGREGEGGKERKIKQKKEKIRISECL